MGPLKPDLEVSPREREAAEEHGKDAWAHGVGLDGARAYSERGPVQRAWQDGWWVCENARRRQSVKDKFAPRGRSG